MKRSAVLSYGMPRTDFLTRHSVVAVVISLTLWCGSLVAQNASDPTNSTKPFSIRATHLLGFEGTPANASGTLLIQDDALEFQRSGQTPVQVKVGSVQDVFLGEESRQVGGTAMTLGKAAAPFGGGRAVSLFAHKKYDTVALEYADPDGAIHGAVFQLDKGQGEVLKNELVAKGAHVSHGADEPVKQSNAEVRSENQ